MEPDNQPKVECGRLELYLGPMFSSKSSTLIAKITQYADLGFDCLYINHEQDTRDCIDEISTHNSGYKGLSENVDFIKIDDLSLIVPEEYSIISVDECQFFQNLVENVTKWVDMGKIVLVAGLDGDYRRKPIGETIQLVCLADVVVKLQAKCVECLKNKKLTDAPFTHRTTQQTDQIVVGGGDIYKPVCRKCYIELNKINVDTNEPSEDLILDEH